MKECMQKNYMRNNQNSMDALGQFPIAMAYVPWQHATRVYENLDEAFQKGTIYPDLYKPFDGRRCK